MTIKELFGSIEGISAEDIKDWLIARHYILGKCKHLDGPQGISPNSDKHVHVIITMDNEENEKLTMAIARQVALLTHYPNFNEAKETTRTIISIIYYNTDSVKLKDQVKMSMGNLLNYCQFLVDGKDESMYYKSFKSFMPLDIAIELIREGTDSCLCPKQDKKAIRTHIKISDILKTHSCNVPEDSSDIKRSMLINMAYQTGRDIDNLPAYDNANIQRYAIALNYFFSHSDPEKIQEKWEKTGIRDKLSCLFCADCMKERLDGLFDISNKSIVHYIKENKKNVTDTIENNIEALALCEHSRWNVERLILGFRPYTIQERYRIEALFGETKENYRKELKKKGVHIDLCSYRNLRRIDPGNIKYDYFLMLAIPYILLKD